MYGRAISFWLEAKGAIAFVVGNAREAKKLAEREKFDVLLTTVQLPDSNGVALATELTSAYEIPCVIYTSTLPLNDHLEAGLEIDADLFLRKPFMQAALWKLISDRA
jgi:DNA-binding response OmpR family regulator